MVLRSVLIALPVALALGMASPAGAEERMPDPGRCGDWTSVPDREAGKTLTLKRVVIPNEMSLKGRFKDVKAINGSFRLKKDLSIAIILEEGKPDWARTFTVAYGPFADFSPYNNLFKEPFKVSTGIFDKGDFDEQIRPLIDLSPNAVFWCRQGGPKKKMDEVESEGLLVIRPSPGLNPPDLSSVFSRGRDGAVGLPGSEGRDLKESTPSKGLKPYFPTESASPGLRDSIGEPPRIGEKFGVLSPPAPSDLPKSSERTIGDLFARADEPPVPPRGIDASPAESAPRSEPTPEKAAEPRLSEGRGDSASSICHAETLASLALAPRGAKPTPPARVGLRNAQTQAEAYDFMAAGGDVVSMKSSASLADSTGKLLAYEPVGLPRRDASGKNWVSVAGLDASRLKRVGSPVRGSVKRIRILVVGGAPEIAVSGLDKVETEMRRQTRDTLKLSLDWRAVGPSGRLTEAGRYESFEDLVKAAESRAAGREPDVLEEAQLNLFLDGFQSLLEGETSVIDKVFWVKGAYRFPATFPPRFERLITSVSAGPVVRKTPAGKPAKWLVALTADVPGFSVAYLQEVVYAQDIGDVLKEDRTSLSTPRRLVPDPAGFAARFLAGTPPAVPAASEEPAVGGPVGRLVIEAGAVFEQRGHLVSRDTAERLRAAIDKTRVSLLIADATERSSVAATPEASEIVAALLRSEPDPAVPRWPRPLPEWTQKLSPAPGPVERQAAETFLQQYRAGLDRLADAVRQRRCGLFFVPDTMLFPF